MDSKEKLIPIVLLSLLLYAALGLAADRRELLEAGGREKALRQELEQLRARKLQLQQRLEAEMDEQELAQLARQRLGLVLPGEKIFYFTTDREG